MIARAANVPVVIPSDSMEAKEFIKKAYELSEQFDTPVIYRTTTRLAHSQTEVLLKDRVEVEDKTYERNAPKNVTVIMKRVTCVVIRLTVQRTARC